LNLVRVDIFNELVNMAITQEDCISAHRAEKKRKIPIGLSNVQTPRYRLVQNTVTWAPPPNNPSGRWIARPPQQPRFNRPPVLQPQQQLSSRPNLLQLNRETTTIVVSIAAAHRISSEIALNLGNHSKDRRPTRAARARARSKLCKSAKGGWISQLSPNFLRVHQ
jgi:hypothetical protein